MSGYDKAVDPLLSVRDLHVHFATEDGWVTAVEGVDLNIYAGQTLGLVGESGCGKSVTARALMRLLDERNTRYSGEVNYEGVNLLELNKKEIRAYRGKRISMVFQDPMTSLDPVFTVGNQLVETLRLHHKISKKEAIDRATDLIAKMGIPDPRRRLDEYPHQLSGGMRQRVMIAIALAADPALLIADEPTTALDVTTQAQILELLAQLQDSLGMALMFISHDLAVVKEVCDHISIMYLGQIIESGATKDVMENPVHPYTNGLLNSAPSMHQDRHSNRLTVIPGRVPGLTEKPVGCYFRPRCSLAREGCEKQPALDPIGGGRAVRCWVAQQQMLSGGVEND